MFKPTATVAALVGFDPIAILNRVREAKIAQLTGMGMSLEKAQKLVPASILPVKHPSQQHQPSILNKEVEAKAETDPIFCWESEGGSFLEWGAPIPKETKVLPVPYVFSITKRIELSNEQESAISAALAGNSFCLIGKAGTGKTTTVKELAYRMESAHKIPPMRDVEGHKYLQHGSIGIVCCAFTNRAINNISKSFDLGTTRINFMTVHKLLEYIREDYSYEDPETHELKSSSRFVPSRNRMRLLPQGLRVIIIEEASMVSIDLWSKLKDACHNGIQFIFLGDLQQLPPPYGEGILGYKLNELPCIELTKIYRQAAENPIIALAWDIANGEKLSQEVITKKYLQNKGESAPIKISFMSRKIGWELAVVAMGNFFCDLIDRKILDPMEDIILVPYNKQLGSIELNKRIAQHVSEAAGQETYEIIAGFQKHWFAIGDKVLYNKKEGIITKITKNGRYVGKTPLPPSINLHRDGSYHAKDSNGAKISPESLSEEEIDFQLQAMMSQSDEDVTNQASHIVHVQLIAEQMEDGSRETEISTRGEYANLLLAYAITIHKAQGSEWRKVFLLFHNTHYHINREMLYTAVTRASQQLFVMCESNTFEVGIKRQRIPGITLQAKILWFKEKIDEMKRKMEAAKAAGKKMQMVAAENGEEDDS